MPSDLPTATQVKENGSVLLQNSGISDDTINNVYVPSAARELYEAIGVTYDPDSFTGDHPQIIWDAILTRATAEAIFYNYMDKPDNKGFMDVVKTLKADAYKKIENYITGKRRQPAWQMEVTENTPLNLIAFADDTDTNTEYRHQKAFLDSLFSGLFD